MQGKTIYTRPPRFYSPDKVPFDNLEVWLAAQDSARRARRNGRGRSRAAARRRVKRLASLWSPVTLVPLSSFRTIEGFPTIYNTSLLDGVFTKKES